jgi:hypothetical protein
VLGNEIAMVACKKLFSKHVSPSLNTIDSLNDLNAQGWRNNHRW